MRIYAHRKFSGQQYKYIDYTINHKNWVPKNDAVQGTFNFDDDDDDIPPVKPDGCPF